MYHLQILYPNVLLDLSMSRPISGGIPISGALERHPCTVHNFSCISKSIFKIDVAYSLYASSHVYSNLSLERSLYICIVFVDPPPLLPHRAGRLWWMAPWLITKSQAPMSKVSLSCRCYSCMLHNTRLDYCNSQQLRTFALNFVRMQHVQNNLVHYSFKQMCIKDYYTRCDWVDLG